MEQADTNQKGEKERNHFIHVVVDANGRANPIQFDHSPVTGQEIRLEAKVGLEDDLTRLDRGKPVGGNIGLADPVDIKNGDRFQALPGGSIS